MTIAFPKPEIKVLASVVAFDNEGAQVNGTSACFVFHKRPQNTKKLKQSEKHMESIFSIYNPITHIAIHLHPFCTTTC